MGTARVVRNFIHKHGKEALRKMITDFTAQRSGQEIARELGVTRQRVNQWKEAFGVTVTSYVIHPEVIQLFGTAPDE